MNLQPEESMSDDEKVSVTIDQITNGFVVRRSWCEKKKVGDREDYDYKSEEFYMKSLPSELKSMFNKGSAKMYEDEQSNGFDKANKAWVDSKKNKESEEE